MLNERERSDAVWCISMGGWDTWESIPQKQAKGNCMIFAHGIGVLVSPLPRLSGHLECNKSAGMLCG